VLVRRDNFLSETWHSVLEGERAGAVRPVSAYHYFLYLPSWRSVPKQSKACFQYGRGRINKRVLERGLGHELRTRGKFRRTASTIAAQHVQPAIVCGCRYQHAAPTDSGHAAFGSVGGVEAGILGAAPGTVAGLIGPVSVSETPAPHGSHVSNTTRCRVSAELFGGSKFKFPHSGSMSESIAWLETRSTGRGKRQSSMPFFVSQLRSTFRSCPQGAPFGFDRATSSICCPGRRRCKYE